jgi:hypothetical protein
MLSCEAENAAANGKKMKNKLKLLSHFLFLIVTFFLPEFNDYQDLPPCFLMLFVFLLVYRSDDGQA